jgi:hypothetical protein
MVKTVFDVRRDAPPLQLLHPERPLPAAIETASLATNPSR